MTTLIKNGLIVTGDNVFPGDLLIRDGKIVEIGTETTQTADEVIDAAGQYILPGGVDASVHLSQEIYGITTADDFESGGRAAAFGGTTTILNFAGASKGSYKRGLDEWLKLAEGKSPVDYSFHLSLTAYNERSLAEIPAVMREGITSFICYYSSRDLLLDEGQLYHFLKIVAGEKGIVGIHPGSGPLTLVMEKECIRNNDSSALAHASCRPPQAEGFAANTTLTLAELADAMVYLMHVSSAHALEKLKIFRDRGNAVYGETCPHYLTLTDETLRADDFTAARNVCSPPLRPAWHLESLWRGIRSGDIQFVSSDHLPFKFDGQKTQGKKDFRRIPAGVPGIEQRLLLLYDRGVCTGRISLSKLVQLLSVNPARLFGLYPRKGAVAVGSDADLLLLNPEGKTMVAAASHHSNVDYTPYEGMELKGAIERVFLRGRQIVQNGQFTGENGYGLFLKRALPTPF